MKNHSLTKDARGPSASDLYGRPVDWGTESNSFDHPLGLVGDFHGEGGWLVGRLFES